MWGQGKRIYFCSWFKKSIIKYLCLSYWFLIRWLENSKLLLPYKISISLFFRKVTIHTCALDAKIGTKLEFDSSGQITNRRSLARSQGTTVCVNELFYDLPVRRRHLTDPNRLPKEFAKVISMLTAYCLVSIGVQISCSRIGKKG